MGSQKNRTRDQIARHQRVTLLDLLDRLLDRGVMVKGEVLLSVADIDLVYLNLGLLLSSVKTVEHGARRSNWSEAEEILRQSSSQEKEANMLQWEEEKEERVVTSTPQENSHRRDNARKTSADTLPSAIGRKPDKRSETKTNIDHEQLEKGLVKLVLTLVDLIRKLMEKQAIRRIEDGQLSDREIEDVGNTFLLLDEKMNELKEKFGLKNEDLNVDLGPLGELV